MSITGIYKIENKINHKVYIGQSINITDRWRNHRSAYKDASDKAYETHLYRSMRKYGIENFDFSIVEECLSSELNERERYWVSYYDSFFNGYNLTLGGDGATGGSIDKEKIKGIINDLLNTTLTQRQIAEKWQISEEMVQGMNTGRYWKHDREYPIRKQKRREKYFCIDCGKEICYGSTRCLPCENAHRVTEKPISREELKQLIRTTPFTTIGKMFGVSDNTIRKWCKSYSLPSKSGDIKKFSNQEWELI